MVLSPLLLPMTAARPRQLDRYKRERRRGTSRWRLVPHGVVAPTPADDGGQAPPTRSLQAREAVGNQSLEATPGVWKL
jgi:hypothetical protein